MTEQTSHNDQQLEENIKAAREGDLASFERILTAFERRIFAYIMRLVSNREDAEDLTQDVFVKVFKKINTFDQKQSFKTWLYTIATNTVYDFLRAKRVRKELLVLDDPLNTIETEDPTDTYELVENEYDVAEGLSRLKPSYRSILLLYYMEQMSCEEIGTMLKLPVGTVKTHLFRARKDLKEAFGTR